MACFNPVVAYRGKVPNAVSGKTPMVFSSRDAADADDPIKLPCGRCIGCRLERSRQWAVRCVHEAQLYERNCFITLTYNQESLPKSGSLEKRDFQLFMKRLRKKHGAKIRFFHCGEYGESCRVCGLNKIACFKVCNQWTPQLGRPHYHACLFNFDFSDRVLWSVRDGVRLDVSADLAELWPYGFSTVGDVTFESAAYVARYITKKITGDAAKEYYQWVNPLGEVFDREPEYITMSRRPGIGRDWLAKYTGDVYPHDRVVLRKSDGSIMLGPPPKYYDYVFELADAAKMDDIKEARKLRAVVFAKDSTFERLRVREQIQYLRFQRLNRGIE